MFGRPLWTILLALERCLLDVAHREMTLDWENLRLFWTSSGEVSNSRECRFEIGNMDYDELGDSAVTSASIRFVKDE